MDERAGGNNGDYRGDGKHVLTQSQRAEQALLDSLCVAAAMFANADYERERHVFMLPAARTIVIQ